MIRIFDYESGEYMQELALRNKILRKPLGMNLYDEDLSQDVSDIHVGAFESGKLVGVILLSPINMSTLKMRQVAVDDEYQRKGNGRILVEFCENYSRDNNYKKITMHARKNALGFYRKLGYEVVGDEFIEIGIPHFKMEKQL